MRTPGAPEPLNVEGLDERQPPGPNITGTVLGAALVGSLHPDGDAIEMAGALDKIDDALAPQGGNGRNRPHAHINMLAAGPVPAERGDPVPQFSAKTVKAIDDLFSSPDGLTDPRLPAAGDDAETTEA